MTTTPKDRNLKDQIALLVERNGWDNVMTALFDCAVAAEQKFAVGDRVRLNQVGTWPEEVVYVNHPMVTTTRGEYHWTKVVKV
jgi:hypothetical protein